MLYKIVKWVIAMINKNFKHDWILYFVTALAAITLGLAVLTMVKA